MQPEGMSELSSYTVNYISFLETSRGNTPRDKRSKASVMLEKKGAPNSPSLGAFRIRL